MTEKSAKKRKLESVKPKPLYEKLNIINPNNTLTRAKAEEVVMQHIKARYQEFYAYCDYYNTQLKNENSGKGAPKDKDRMVTLENLKHRYRVIFDSF